MIIQDGIRRMYQEQESVFYYLTVMNEQYAMPAMPEGSREGILKGMYSLQAAANPKAKLKAQLLGSGAILNEVRRGAEAAREVRRRRRRLERHQLPGAVSRRPRVRALEHAAPGPRRRASPVRHAVPRRTHPACIVAASDYLKVLPDSIDRWMPRRMRSLGTDGFGRSEDRQRLRDFFEVDARFVTLATLAELAQDGQIDRKVVAQAIKDLGSIRRSRIRRRVNGVEPEYRRHNGEE